MCSLDRFDETKLQNFRGALKVTCETDSLH